MHSFLSSSTFYSLHKWLPYCYNLKKRKHSKIIVDWYRFCFQHLRAFSYKIETYTKSVVKSKAVYNIVLINQSHWRNSSLGWIDLFPFLFVFLSAFWITNMLAFFFSFVCLFVLPFEKHQFVYEIGMHQSCPFVRPIHQYHCHLLLI